MALENPYAPAAGRAVRRLLSLLDRDPTSSTYGCLDRPYWFYKTLVEFPAGTWQEAALALAIAYRTPFEGNPVAGTELGLEWALSAVRYWAKCQNRDGSVNEWFHREHSFCATSFTTLAIAEASELLGDSGPRGALARAAAWLLRHDNELVANQRCGAAGALLAAGRLTGEARFEKAGRERLERVLASQHPEGWFPEYGGADLGYLSVSTSALARALRYVEDPRLEEGLARAVRFTLSLLAPDGSAGSATGSRQTRFLMPLGFEILARRGHAGAAAVASALAGALERGRGTGPDEVDDRYLAFFFASNWLGALREFSPKSAPALEAASVRWPGAGLLRHVAGGLSTVIALRNQGALVVHSGGEEPRRVLAHFGYRLGFEDGSWGASIGRAGEAPSEVREADGALEVRIEAPFLSVDRSRPLERLVVPFKIYTTTLARIDAVAQRVTRRIKKKILGARPLPARLVRRVSAWDAEIRIVDEITLLGGRAPVQVEAEGLASPMHVPSTRFYRADDLEGRPMLPDGQEAVRRLRESLRLEIEWRVSRGPDGAWRVEARLLD